MNKTIIAVAGFSLASGMAIAQEQEDQAFNPNRDIVTEPKVDPQTTMGDRQQDTAVQSDYGNEPTYNDDATYGDQASQSSSAATSDDSMYGDDSSYGDQESQDSSTAATTDDGMYGDQDTEDATHSSSTADSTYGDESAYGDDATHDGAAHSSAAAASTASASAMDNDGMSEDLTSMSADELEGMKVVTLTGEEIGEIGEVGESAQHGTRIATVEVGGFLGIGEKTIAIPLSDLDKSVSDDESVRTSMSRESIESEAEFDETGFTPDQ